MAPLVVKGRVLIGVSGDFDNLTGYIRSVDPETGATQWQWDSTPPAGTPGQTTGGMTWMTGTYDPDLNLVYWGTGNPTPVLKGTTRPGDDLYTCTIVALNPDTGKLVWKTRVDTHDSTRLTGGPAAYDGTVYVPVSSWEETRAGDKEYACCTFRGSAVALNAQTGKILWKTYMVPEGWSGGPIWGSTAAVDPSRGSLYVATGNNYSLPPAVQACENANGTNCDSPDNHFDSMLSLDLSTGVHVRSGTWRTQSPPGRSAVANVRSAALLGGCRGCLRSGPGRWPKADQQRRFVLSHLQMPTRGSVTPERPQHLLPARRRPVQAVVYPVDDRRPVQHRSGIVLRRVHRRSALGEAP